MLQCSPAKYAASTVAMPLCNCTIKLISPAGALINGVPLCRCFSEKDVMERANLDEATGTLTLTVSNLCTIPTGYKIVIGALLRNPAAAQAAPVITLSVGHPGCTQCVPLCSCGIGDFPTFAIAPVTVTGTVLQASVPLSLTTRCV